MVAARKNKTAKTADQVRKEVKISAPNFQTISLPVVGTSRFMQQKWSAKAQAEMRRKQEVGTKPGVKGAAREAKDFAAACEAVTYHAVGGGYGIPAAAFGQAMVRACTLVGFKMAVAKLAIFVLEDTEDIDSGRPLVAITKGQPAMSVMPVRLQGKTCDLRARPVWAEGWEATVRVRYDADLFSEQDIANLIMRAGEQVGVGEGRAERCAMGFGFFTLKNIQKGGA